MILSYQSNALYTFIWKAKDWSKFPCKISKNENKFRLSWTLQPLETSYVGFDALIISSSKLLDGFSQIRFGYTFPMKISHSNFPWWLCLVHPMLCCDSFLCILSYKFSKLFFTSTFIKELFGLPMKGSILKHNKFKGKTYYCLKTNL